MIDKKLEKKLDQMAKRFTNLAKKAAEEFGVGLDVAIKMSISLPKVLGEKNDVGS